ncbi:penicillin-binding transpeptidase domain-containing protein [Clostridium amazonitimonense]|uniref:penicillin-binding transpeptidase domain-containing protein n=1 Tax=Clostridium amazonitimonense TaxID=1499689 RepID=UPI000509B5FB|nr:penicillin-binding transpeptidase domain-containing protein [Clostridium amazonitimonense]
MRHKIFKRVKVVGISTTLVFILLILRIVQIQYFYSDRLEVMANSQYRYKENINELKFSVLDSKNRNLIEYNRKYILVIDPATFKRNNSSTEVNRIYAFNYILKNYNKDYDLATILESPNSARLYINLNKEAYEKLKAVKGIKGTYLYMYDEVQRSKAWKIENMITNFKYNKNDIKPENSLEGAIYLKTKDNNTPSVIFEKDVDGNINEGIYDIDESNMNIRLTLDKEMQEAVREILSAEKYKHYDQIGVTIVEANTGKIKVMAQKDESKPNINLASTTENGYVPGSIFKLLVEEVAIDRGLFLPQSKFTCELGKYSICKKAHGELTLEEALMISCNNIFAEVGKEIGWPVIEEYARKQGLFEKVLNIHGNGEVTGDFVLPTAYEDGPRLLSIGQNMRITPLQGANIISTIVNEGIYVKPTILEGYVDNYNNMLSKTPLEKTQVIKKNTAKIMKEQMIKVVRDEKGTGKSVYMEGVETGGKTGTTTRMEPIVSEENNKTIMEKHSDGWFAGYYKFKGQYYSMVVFVKDINEENQYGGSTAGPIFKEIVESLLK